MLDSIRRGDLRHGDRVFYAGCTIVHAPQKVMVNINHCVDRLPPSRHRPTHLYRAAANDSAIAWNSSRPSADPSSASLDRSGCGIIPSTLRPSFNTPAILSNAPFGFAFAVTSPSGVA